MNLYLVSRYGAEMFSEELNPELESTKDSNLLVRAESWGRAAEFGHSYFADIVSRHPAFQAALKSGAHLCDYIVQIGTDTENQTEEVIHGPFLSHAIIRGQHASEIAEGRNACKSWTYDQVDKVWRKVPH